MRVRIVEQDQAYKESLAHWLLAQGFERTTEENVLEINDGGLGRHIIETVHGIAEVKPEDTDMPQIKAWLENYTGNFEFYLSLKSQLATRGDLSDKQKDAVRRAITRDSAPRPQSAQRSYSIEVGTNVLLSKRFAKEIAAKAGLTRPHFIFEVVGVLAETERAFRLSLRLSAQRTSHCSICGLSLTDPQSVIAGIGPVCAEKYGISHGDRSLEELKEKLTQTTTVDTWLPKAVIKERM